MSFDEPAPKPSKGARPRQSAVRIVPARAAMAPRPEFRRDGEWLEVSFAAPEIPQGKFRHRLGKRYVLVWADDAPQGQQYFAVLPVSVDPRGHQIRFVNGVVDARVRVARR